MTTPKVDWRDFEPAVLEPDTAQPRPGETDAPHESPDNYATPLLVPVEGKLQLIVSGGDYVTGHDPNSGSSASRSSPVR